MTTLKGLRLSRNNIGRAGVAAMAGGLQKLTGLGKLDLSHNNIGPDGPKADMNSKCCTFI